MYKTVRSLSLALLLTLSVVPVKADRWGTNPRPQSSVTDDDSSMMETMGDTFSFYLGIF